MSSSGVTNFYVFRHPETYRNHKGEEIQGWINDGDAQLNEAGLSGAHQLGKALKDAVPDPAVIVSSDLSRSLDTAKIISGYYSKKNGSLLNCALSKEAREMTLFVWGSINDIEKSGLNGLYYRPLLKDLFKTSCTEVKVKTMNLDEFCHQNNIEQIHLLKIDTEGSEWDVLIGAKEMISKKAIKRIQFEYGDCYLDSQTTLKSVYHFLKQNHYRIFRILPTGLKAIDNWDEELENYQYCNYAAVLSEET